MSHKIGRTKFKMDIIGVNNPRYDGICQTESRSESGRTVKM